MMIAGIELDKAADETRNPFINKRCYCNVKIDCAQDFVSRLLSTKIGHRTLIRSFARHMLSVESETFT